MQVNTPTRKPALQAPLMETGIVQGCGREACIVLSEAGIRSARRAAGCLLQPQAGDRVLCINDERGQYYILNVLERSAETPAVVDFEHGAVIRSERGAITLAASQRLDLTAAGPVQLLGKSLAVSAEEAVCRIGRTTLAGDELSSHVSRVRVFADSVATVARSMLQRLKNCFRKVDGLDQLNAGDKLETVQNLSATRARQAVITAEQDVRLDGARVHIG